MRAKASRTIPLLRPTIDAEMRRAVLDALAGEKLVLGESVWRFEEEFARFCGTREAVSVSSGTHALHFALVALGLPGGARVLTSPMSFVASANAVLHAGLEPAFADVDARTANLDPAQVARRLSNRTRALLPVHLYGRPADLPALQEACDSRGIDLIEDACQAHGASIRGRRVGAWGRAACFSFYPSKNLTVAGDGGMVVTDDARISDRVRKLRDSGRRSRYEHDALGYTARLNTINAAIGRVQLRRLPGWNTARRRLADRYRKLLGGVPDVELPPADRPGWRSVYHLFCIRASRRDDLAAFLRRRGIETGVHYPIPIHLQPLYRRLGGYRPGAFPQAERHARRALSLPLFPGLGVKAQAYVAESVRAFYGSGAAGKGRRAGNARRG